MTLFTRLATALNAKGARLDFEMVAMDDAGKIRLRVTPNLGACPDNATDEEQQLRALLGAPLTIAGTPEEVDEALAERLNERMAIQAEGTEALSALREKMAAAAEASKKAKPAKAAKSAGNKTASQPAPASEEEAPGKVTRTDTATPTLDDF